MERLSGLDASFLYVESASVPLHVCSVIELDTSTIPGGYSFDRFQNDLAARIQALPELRTKLADSQLNLDHPVWVEDEDFDVSRHVHRIGMPSPGGQQGTGRSVWAYRIGAAEPQQAGVGDVGDRRDGRR